MTELRFFVPGIPVSQGSLKCIGTRSGFHQLIPSNQATLNPWREVVKARAEHTAAYHHWATLDEAEIRLIFRLMRPQSHYRTGRFADFLRDDAPRYPTTKPDTDKLMRAIFDAIKDAKLVTDDAVIITVTAAKRYTTPEQPPGVNIVLSTPVAPQPALFEGVN